MAYRRKTWREKLADEKGLPKIAKIEGKLSKRWGTGTMVIPAPREVDAMIRTANSVPALGPNPAVEIRRSAGTASRCNRRAFGSGIVVAALLSPRLMDGNLPGCGRRLSPRMAMPGRKAWACKSCGRNRRQRNDRG